MKEFLNLEELLEVSFDAGHCGNSGTKGANTGCN